MAPLVVDPEAMFVAGTAVDVVGDGLATALGPLTAGFGVNSGQDAAGLVFGLAYQATAKSLLKGAAAGINACRHVGAKIQLCASNYSKAEAASTLGGGGHVLPAPSEPPDIVPPGPPGTVGPGVAEPLLWAVVEALLDDVWPNGDATGMHAAAGCWRGFGAALSGVQDALNGPKSAVAAQQVPESELIQHDVSELGTKMAGLGAQCDKLAAALDEFADEVEHAQTAIRDLLHRLLSVPGLWGEVVSFLEGDALDEVNKIAADINAVLHNMKREAQAREQVMKIGLQLVDGLVREMKTFMRGQFTHLLGDFVGQQVATMFDFFADAEEGVFKGAVGLAQLEGQLDPSRFLFDPKGATASWAALDETAVKSIPAYALLDPGGAAKNDLGLVKGLVHWDDWTSGRPGLGFGESAFDVGTLFLGGGALKAGTKGAEAAAGGAEATEELTEGEEVVQGARGAAGELDGVGGALADIGKTSSDLTEDLQNLGGDLPKTDPPPSGSPVSLPPEKLPEAPVESTPRPAESVPPATHEPVPAAAGPREPASPAGPREPAWAPVTPAERLPSTNPQLAEPLPARVPVSPVRSPVEPAPATAHSPQPAPAPAPAAPNAPTPHFTPPGGHPAELPAPHSDGSRGLGDGSRPGGRPHRPHPHGGGPHGHGDGPPGSHRHGPPSHDGPSHGPDDGGPDNDGSAGGYRPTAIDALTSDDLSAIADYTGSGYTELNSALRSDALDASQHARIEALNSALEKLPAYHGPVVRGSNLPPEVLAQYQPGEVITENAFLSTTTNPAVAQSPGFTGNVEFRILSSTGRDISSVSMFPAEQEILFPAGTKFYVVNKIMDPLTGRTIIEMIER